MDKVSLSTKVNQLTKETFDKEKLISWIACLEPTRAKPNTYAKGDVLMHSIFKHPYVLLEKKKDYWLCGLLTSEVTCTEILEQCESRFFNGAFFTRTIFTVADINGGFIGTFDNNKQIGSVLKKLKVLLA